MWINALVSYLHYLSFMLCFGALVLEAHTLKKEVSLSEAWRIVISDAVYGISATIVLITGVLRILYFGKGTDYYLSNSVFYIKVAVFLVVGLASLYPTISFITWLTELQQGQTPKLELAKLKRLKWLIRIELAGFILIPLLATIMARGIGAI
jgi:putative membrane protein